MGYRGAPNAPAHRDLKPDNVLVLCDADDDDDIMVKVIDFGCAKYFGKAADFLAETGNDRGKSYSINETPVSGDPVICHLF